MKSTICKNCGASVDANFCGQCGQKRLERISMRQVTKDVYQSLFNFDSPFLKTFITLTINPGKVYREYIQGVRVRYFSPIRYSLWLMTLGVAIAGFTDTTIINFTHGSGDTDDELLKTFAIYQTIINAAFIPIVFFSAFPMAILARLLWRVEKYNVAEYYIPYLLNSAHFSIVMSVAMLFGVYENAWFQVIMSVGAVMYMSWGVANIFEPVTAKRYWQSTIVAMLGALVVILIFTLLPFIMHAILRLIQ